MLIMFLFTGNASETTDVYHYELKTERLILEGKYEQASHVGERSLQSSERLTTLRMYALSMEDSLPDRIFSYPQYYGTRGLLNINDTSYLYRLKAPKMCKNIGAYCGSNIKNTKRYLDLLVANDTLRTKRAIDYQLCYILLDKNLNKFTNKLYKHYNPHKVKLPKSYQEALLLKADQQGDSLDFISEEISARYTNYKIMKSVNLDSLERSNKTRREYGDTYWWYYDNL